MSEKSAKKERKDLKERREAFLKGMNELSAKYKIGLAPVLQFLPEGLRPAMVVVDEKEKYEHVTPEAQKQNELEEKRKLETERLAPKVET